MQLEVEISADADAYVACTTSKHLFVKETTGTIAQHTVKQTKVAKHVEGLFASGVLFLTGWNNVHVDAGYEDVAEVRFPSARGR
jgi:hypothetical protein